MEAQVCGDKVSLPCVQAHKVPNGIETRLHGRQTRAIYNIERHDIFIPWFQTTPYYKAMQEHGSSKEACFNNPARRNQEIWANFQEAADINSGEPALICNFCSATIQHPFASATTKSMLNHLNSGVCRRSPKRKASDDAHQTNITKYAQKVCLSGHPWGSLLQGPL